MFAVAAYMLSAWCYVAALTIVVWIVPHVLSRFGLLIQLGVYLFAVGLIIRGNEAWMVADGAEAADYWLVRNLFAPAGATLILIGGLTRNARRKRKQRAKVNRQVLLLFNIYHVATEQIARANKEEIQSLRAEFAELRQELSRQNREFMEQSFQREKAKTDFDLFYEHYRNNKVEK